MRHWRPLALLLFAALAFPLTFHNQLDPALAPVIEDGSWRTHNHYAHMALESWKRYSPLALSFTIRFPRDDYDLARSVVYSSYGPGFLLPPYLAQLAAPAAPGRPTLRRLEWMAHAAHFLLALVAGFTALAVAGEIAPALAAVAAVFFLPHLLLVMHTAWWTDCFGLLLTAACFLLALRCRTNAPLAWRAGLGASFAAATLTDWFAPVLGFSLLPLRRLRWPVALGVAAAFLLFALQMWWAGELLAALNKAQLRIGISGEPVAFPERLRRHFTFGLVSEIGHGAWLWPALAIPLACLWKEARPRAKLLAPLLIAVALHWLVFNEHYSLHSYNAIRWCYALALLPALFPRRVGLLASLAMIAFAFSFYPGYLKDRAAREPSQSADRLAALELVGRNQDGNTLMISGEDMGYYSFHFPYSWSMIRQTKEKEDLLYWLRFRPRGDLGLRKPARILYLGHEPAPPAWVKPGTRVAREGDWSLFEVAVP